MKTFAQENEAKLADNKKALHAFEHRIADLKSDAKAKYEKRLATLDAQNSDLKKRLADFSEKNKQNWTSMKKEFSHDLQQLGHALKGFVIKDVK